MLSLLREPYEGARLQWRKSVVCSLRLIYKVGMVNKSNWLLCKTGLGEVKTADYLANWVGFVEDVVKKIR